MSVLLIGTSSSAGEVDTIAALIAADAADKTVGKTPAVQTGSVRGDAKTSRSLPPLPRKNPLRQLKQSGSSPQHTATLPLPTRIGLISNHIKSLAPILNYKILSSDINALKRSIDFTRKNRLGDAQVARTSISDPAVRKLALWYHLRKAPNIADPMAMERFRTKNSDWPSNALLRRRVERALLKNNASSSQVKALFGKKAPTTGVGKYLLARAHKLNGQHKKALKLVRSAWHRYALGAKTEKALLSDFGDKLTKSDHRRRVDHFLYKDNRRYLPTVRRARKHLSKREQAKVNVRMEVIKRRLNDAKKQFDKLGKKALSDAGLLFNKIQMLRRKKKYDHSRRLLAKAPIDVKSMVEPDEWWIERRVQTRYALRHNKPLAAYNIASRHGKISRKHQFEAEFLAGWIALTRLNRSKAAAGHFAKQRKAARTRREIAKVEYWLGRLKLKQKDAIGALGHFATSSKYFRTYYGQLAMDAVGHKGYLGYIPPPTPSRRDLKRFINRDAVRALVIAHKAELPGLVPLFFNRLAWRLKSPGEMALLAELASQIHSKRGAVITGKVGVYRGFKLDRYAYPINAMPHFKQLTDKVDPSLVLALARQESEFNAKAKSPVGARGMMQIMPGTARAIARAHNVRYSRSRLTSDPSYNVALGVAHLHDLIQQYNGSYILPLVAYNAGPGRVRDWIESFGDPRSADVNTVDWIESIPFTETRRYVQRIMSSIQIFRARMSDGKGQIRLVRDINRGHPNRPKEADNATLLKVNLTNN